MASNSFVKNGNGLMFLSLGTLVLLLTAYFVVNTNFSSGISAHPSNVFKGKLVSDPHHLLSCNLSIKADYVLEDLSEAGKCTPVVANKSSADKFVGHTVALTGVSTNRRYFATNFADWPSASASPSPTYSPKPKSH